ncbi:MAG: D-alanyl-D-alanine carboxypeptidase family protein [Pseudomonadota bacterium]
MTSLVPVLRLPLIALIGLACLLASAQAKSVDTIAKHAVLLDTEHGDILFEKQADTPMPPASMSKLMTLEVLFNALKEGRVGLDDTFFVSEKAWRKGGSKMFVEVNTQVAVSDLLRGIIVQSGNDACIVVAEGLAGSEEAFAVQMNARAKAIGLTGSNFTNASGWPDPDHRMSARDLAVLANHIVETYPEYYSIFQETEFTYSGIRQYNRNPLLRLNVGVDGMKTGHTEESGYGLVSTAERDGRRLVLVVNGLESELQRKSESARLLEVGFLQFQPVMVYSRGEIVGEVPVWLGQVDEVPLAPSEDVRFYLPAGLKDQLTVKTVVDEPVEAPIAADAVLGTLQIKAPGYPTREVPLVAAREIAKAGFAKRIGVGLKTLVIGKPAAAVAAD